MAAPIIQLPPELLDAFVTDLELGRPLGPEVLQSDVRAGKGFAFNGKVQWAAESTPATLEITYYDELVISASAIVHDGAQGTIGLVHVLPDENRKAWIREQLETATYLRHLCVEWTPDDHPHPVVEIVFVTLDSQPSPDLLTVFREVMEQTSLMHGLGVGVLNVTDLGTNAIARGRVLSRAFPWLLRSTRRWIISQQQNSGEKTATDPLRELRLENFRLAGTRRLRLAPDAQVHLVHGQNGSGKSSISEALELAITGKSQRVEEHSKDKNYISVFRNQYSSGDARISLQLNTGGHDLTVESTGVSNPILPELSPLAFRLDQQDVTKLTKSPRDNRAAMFLDAFFREHKEAARTYKAALDDISTIRSTLPAQILEGVTDQQLLDLDLIEVLKSDPMAIYAFLEPQRIVPISGFLTGRVAFDWDTFISRLPEYRGVKPRAADLSFNASESSISDYLQILDRIWKDVQRKTKRGEAKDKLLVAADFVEKLAGWRAATSFGSEPIEPRLAAYPERLNTWLRESALCDMIAQQIALQRTLSRLDANSRAQAAEETLLKSTSISALREKLTHHQNERQRAKHYLDLGATSHSNLRKGRHFKLRILPREVEALNWTGQFLGVPSESHGLLGDVIKTAILEDRGIMLERQDQQPLEIGHSRAESLNRLADEIRIHATQLEHRLSPARLSPVSPSQCYQSFKSLIEAVRRASGEGALAYQAFTNSVNHDLSEAINELTALMTPARWAYPDITISLDGDELQQLVRSSPAELFLNTAEQNAATISLFLLCAFGLAENSTCTIVLDDPFENMDELTTTQVARALTRFLRLWNKETGRTSWQIIMLLHGAENTERMRDETPCEAYFLPWLAPGNVPDNDREIESERKRFSLFPPKAPR